MNSLLLDVAWLSIVGSLWMILLLLLKKPLFKKVSRRCWYVLWLLVTIRMIVPFGAGKTIISWRDAQLTQFQNSQENTLSTQVQTIDATPLPQDQMMLSENQTVANDSPSILSEDTTMSTQTQTPATTHQQDSMQSMMAYLPLCIWVIGICVSLCWYFIPYIHLQRQMRRFRKPVSDKIRHLWQQYDRDGRIKVYYHPFGKGPCLVGLIHPSIYLPKKDYLINEQSSQLSYVFAHEFVHYQRKDIWMKFLLIIASSIHWFNPMMLVLRHQLTIYSELACDEAVIMRLNLQDRQAYGETLLQLAMKKTTSTILTTAMSQEKKELKERLVCIMENRKSKKVVFGISGILIAGIVVGTALSGPGMQAHDANATKRASQSSGTTKVTETSIASNGEHFKDTVTLEKNITAYIDAELPDASASMRVVNVQPRDISIDDVKRWSNVFYGDSKVYEEKYVMTKAEVEEAIQWRKEKIGDQTALLAEYQTQEETDNITAFYKEQIANLERALLSATETYARPDAEYAFHTEDFYTYLNEIDSEEEQNYWKNTGSLQCKLIGEVDGSERTLNAFNHNADDRSLHYITYYDHDGDKIQHEGKAVLSTDEASALAEKYLAQLVDGDWQQTSADSWGNVWDLTYIPVYSGTPVYAVDFTTIDFNAEDSNTANQSNEYITFKIVGTEIFEVEWQSPSTILDETVEAKDLLSFDAVYPAAQTWLKENIHKTDYIIIDDEMPGSTMTMAESENAKLDEAAASLHIDQIKSGLYRVKVKDTANDFQYVPAYLFYGYMDTAGYSRDDEQIRCIINAVDGSAINPALGY